MNNLNEHFLTQNSPGSLWLPSEKKLLIPKHKVTPGELFSDQHYHLYVRAGLVDALKTKSTDLSVWIGLYYKMQITRVGVSKVDNFIEMVQKFHLGEFSSDPIPTDPSLQLLDGAHRTACSAVFKLLPEVEVFENPSHPYDKHWFKKNGFSDEELSYIDTYRHKLDSDIKQIDPSARVIFIWSYALSFWDDILGEIGLNSIQKATIRDFGRDIEQIIVRTYEGDGMVNERIVAKSKQIRAHGTQIGIIIAKHDHASITKIKGRVRNILQPKIPNYFFDCIIHAIDDTLNGHRIIKDILP